MRHSLKLLTAGMGTAVSWTYSPPLVSMALVESEQLYHCFHCLHCIIAPLCPILFAFWWLDSSTLCKLPWADAAFLSRSPL